ncbi:MAG: MFS transporter [Spirochaetes bacterium]|nr:MFS transporter [Spirochaetota bacterium]
MSALARRLFAFKEGEARPAGLLFALFFVVSFGNGIGLSAGESLFIQAWGIEQLPFAFLAAALTVLTAAVLLARLGQRRALSSFWRAVYAAAAAIALVLTAGLYLFPGSRGVSALLFVFAYTALVLLKNLLLQLSEAMFDLRQLKRFFALVSSGAVLGMALGGLGLGALLAVLPDTRALIAVWALALCGALWLSVPIFRRHTRAENLTEKRREAPAGLLDGFRNLAKSRLFLLLGVASFCTAFLVLQYDFLYMFAVKKTYGSPEEVTKVFGLVRGASTLATFVFQAFFTASLLRVLGLAPVLMLFPAAFLGIYGMVLVRFGMLNVFLGRVGYYLTKEAFYFPSLQPVFNALSEPMRRGAVFFIYSVMGSLGNIAGGLFLLLAVRTGILSLKGSMLVALALGAVLVATTLLIRKAYVKELLSNLQEDSPQQLERVENLRALGGSDAPGMLLAMLQSGDEENVRFSLEFLSRARDAQRDAAVEQLATQTALSPVRRACFRYFGRTLSAKLLERARGFLSGPDRLPFVDWLGACLAEGTAASLREEAEAALREAMRLPDERVSLAAAVWAAGAGIQDEEILRILNKAVETVDPIQRVFVVERFASHAPRGFEGAFRVKAMQWLPGLSARDPLAVRLVKSLLKLEDPALVASLVASLTAAASWRPLLPRIFETLEDGGVCERIAAALPSDDLVLLTSLPNPPPGSHGVLHRLSLDENAALPLRSAACDRLRRCGAGGGEGSRAAYEAAVGRVLDEAFADLRAAASFLGEDKAVQGIFTDEMKRQVRERLSLASGLIELGWTHEHLGGALAALDSENRALRTAALETLENTLPRSIREPFTLLQEWQGAGAKGLPLKVDGEKQLPPAAALERLFLGATPWRRLLAMHLAGRLDAKEYGPRIAAVDDPYPESEAMRGGLITRWGFAPSS